MDVYTSVLDVFTGSQPAASFDLPSPKLRLYERPKRGTGTWLNASPIE